jgi:DNA-binding CsgD family transcriptional regulator
MDVRRGVIDSVVTQLASGRSCVLRGPAGIGKTRTAREVVDAMETLGITVRRAVGSLSAQRIPLGAFASLLGVGRGSPAERVSQAIAAAGRGARTALVVDDAHLLDDASATVLHHLAATNTVTTLSTVRSGESWPDAVRRLWRDGYADVIDLEPLTRNECREIAEHALDSLVDEPTLELLHRSSDGNPLLLIEIIDASRTAGLIRHSNGVWSGASVAAGSGTRELLAGRAATWTDDERMLAEFVAIGQSVPLRVLERLFTTSAIESALTARIVRRSDVAGSIELSHPLLGEHVRASLPSDQVADRLRTLIVAALALDVNGDLSIDLGHWALTLDDRRAIDAATLVSAAHRCHSVGRNELARQLAAAAERAGAAGPDLELVHRVLAAQGAAPSGSQDETDATVAGAAEAFMLGFGPLGDVRTRLRNRARLRGASPERSELEAVEIGVSIAAGAPLDPAIDDLLDIVHRHDAAAMSSLVAASFATSALNEAARFATTLDIVAHVEASGAPTNEFHRITLGVTRADALRGLGRHAEATAVLFERCGPPEAAVSPVASVLANGSRVHDALDRGDPIGMKRHAAALLATVQGLDSGGLGTWGLGYLRWAQAWCGDPAEDLALVPAEQAQLLWPQATLAVCHALAERGELVASRERARSLADRASASGHRFVALGALHLVARITPAHFLVERLSEIAQRCEGDRVGAVVSHVEALAHNDGVALEKCAHAFEQLGQLAFALESFHVAARAHRTDGRRSSSQRCQAEQARLRAVGVHPTFAASKASEGEPLTAREEESYRFAIEGMSNREIARHLGVSQRTVESHLQRAYRKLGAVAQRT